jgi:hypothetical protein
MYFLCLREAVPTGGTVKQRAASLGSAVGLEGHRQGRMVRSDQDTNTTPDLPPPTHTHTETVCVCVCVRALVCVYVRVSSISIHSLPPSLTASPSSTATLLEIESRDLPETLPDNHT